MSKIYHIATCQGTPLGSENPTLKGYAAFIAQDGRLAEKEVRRFIRGVSGPYKDAWVINDTPINRVPSEKEEKLIGGDSPDHIKFARMLVEYHLKKYTSNQLFSATGEVRFSYQVPWDTDFPEFLIGLNSNTFKFNYGAMETKERQEFEVAVLAALAGK